MIDGKDDMTVCDISTLSLCDYIRHIIYAINFMYVNRMYELYLPANCILKLWSLTKLISNDKLAFKISNLEASNLIKSWNIGTMWRKFANLSPIGDITDAIYHIKKDVTPSLTHWSCFFLALTHRFSVFLGHVCLLVLTFLKKYRDVELMYWLIHGWISNIILVDVLQRLKPNLVVLFG